MARLLVSPLAGLCFAAYAASIFAAARLEAPIAYRAPDVDGRPLEHVWTLAAKAPPFADLVTGTLDPATEARVAVSDLGIHVVYSCQGRPGGVGILSGAAWSDSVVVAVATGQSRFRFDVAVSGATTAWTDGPVPVPELGWSAATNVRPSSWTAELTIPWAVIGGRGSLRLKLARQLDLAVAGGRVAVPRVTVSGAGRGTLEDSQYYLELIAGARIETPPAVRACAGLDTDPARCAGASAFHPLLMGGDLWAASIWLHAPGGTGPLEIRSRSSRPDVVPSVFVVPEWVQAGRGAWVDARVAGRQDAGLGDVSVRELLLEERTIPPAHAPAGTGPVRFAAIPDHPELVVLLVRVAPEAPAGPARVTVEIGGWPEIAATQVTVEVLDLDDGATPRFGVYAGYEVDAPAIAAAGFDEVVTPSGSPEVAEALAREGLLLTAIGAPEAAAKMGRLRPHVYGIDEPRTARQYAECRELFLRAHALGLETATAITSVEALHALAPLLDRAIVNVSLLPTLADDPVLASIPERYAYWQLGIEDPVRHRLLAGGYLWRHGLDGAMPYAWSDASGDPWDDWDGSGPRDLMAVYPLADGNVATVQLIGLELGMADARALAALEALVAKARPEAGGAESTRAASYLSHRRRELSAPYWELLGRMGGAELEDARQEALAHARALATAVRDHRHELKRIQR